MEHIRVVLIDLPHGVRGITIRVDADCYDIYINARLSSEEQRKAYDHELAHIDNQDFCEMYSVGRLEAERHGA